MCIYIYIYIYMCIFPYTLRSGIDVSPQLIFQKSSTQDFIIPITSFIYFWNKFQTR